jgi:hypothetical protein
MQETILIEEDETDDIVDDEPYQDESKNKWTWSKKAGRFVMKEPEKRYKSGHNSVK